MSDALRKVDGMAKRYTDLAIYDAAIRLVRLREYDARHIHFASYAWMYFDPRPGHSQLVWC